MSYRTSPGYGSGAAAPQLSARRIMTAMIVTFVLVSLLVLFAGRLPVTPQPLFPAGPTYREYTQEADVLLSSYGYTLEGRVHIPIDRAMDLVSQRGLPVRDGASPTP
jgi:hypothetical protein